MSVSSIENEAYSIPISMILLWEIVRSIRVE